MKFEELKIFAEELNKLRKIARKLRKYNELFASGDLSSRQERKLDALEMAASAIASNLGLYIQTVRDPRSLSPLYLVSGKEDHYSTGIPIPVK